MGDSIPRVSIGLPVYNGATYLAASIDSLLGQTFGDFELIISDNGSTDATESICRRYADQDKRIRYYRVEENLGCAWNYNRVFELAQGEYFKWAADDDIHLPAFLEKTVALLDERPDVVWCFCRHSHIGPDGDVLPTSRGRDDSFLKTEGCHRASPKPHQRFQSILLAHSGLDIYALHRRELVARTGVYQAYYGSEKVFLAELSMLGPYYELPETLFHVRVHPGASGCLQTEADLLYYIDPQQRLSFGFTRWRLLRGHWQAMHRFPLSFSDRLRCYGSLARYVLQVSKWRRVIHSVLGRKGTGGGYLSYMEVVESAKDADLKSQHATAPSDGPVEEGQDRVSQKVECEL